MSAIADHLGQSTIFAFAAGLLTWILRKNSVDVGAPCRTHVIPCH
jgi:hypothetical protein